MKTTSSKTPGTGILLLWAAVCACSSDLDGPDPSAIPYVPSKADPGNAVTVSLVASHMDDLNGKLNVARQDTAGQLRERHAVQFANELGYDPLTAGDLEMILSAFSWKAMRAQLTKTGLAIDAESQFPSFVHGYSSIYAADLPVFVTADMVLEALYRSHSQILLALERQALRPRLQRLLLSIRTRLIAAAGSLPADVASDLNFYLGVALSLLDQGRVDPREPQGVGSFVQAAMAAKGEQQRMLFGVKQSIDFSQFKPRGHYAGDAELESYFRTMMWLGRIDFRLIETQPDGSQILRRRQIDAALSLRRLLDSEAFADYAAIDRTVGAFVGEHDYMTLQDVEALQIALGVPDSLDDVDDETLATTLIEGQFGQQRIASQVMRRTGGGPATLPFSTSFALFGQRYTVDSHVLSNVVYDRVATRVVPNPLDVAFGALGNGQALTLLGDELDTEAGYPGQLSTIRVLVDEHPKEYWQSSLYSSWLSTLRTLSPGTEPDSDLPTVARSDAWGRRLLNTQLSSWAQLRHNNVLYVKQSYTSNLACEYPDAYVDPYPRFFRGVVEFAERGQQLTAELGLESALGDQIAGYFARVARINTTLAEMAELQRSGMPHSEAHLAFINQAVNVRINCDGTVLGHDGWYSELHFDPLAAVSFDPVISDVHTDVGGDLPVSRPASVLHVATGAPRMIVITVNTCQGPRAYAGMVSAYHEVLEPGLTRLTDEDWKGRVQSADPHGVSWMAPVLTP